MDYVVILATLAAVHIAWNLGPGPNVVLVCPCRRARFPSRRICRNERSSFTFQRPTTEMALTESGAAQRRSGPMNASGERTKSLWMATEVLPDAPPLDGHRQCDTVIVGAGMAGLSTAYELAMAGQRVIVMDRGPVAGGMTSRTTAHLAVSALIKVRG
jgi:hypothetical protein